MNDLNSIVEFLCSVNMDLRLACRGLDVDPQEVADAYEASNDDTAENHVLQILSEMHPVLEITEN